MPRDDELPTNGESFFACLIVCLFVFIFKWGKLIDEIIP